MVRQIAAATKMPVSTIERTFDDMTPAYPFHGRDWRVEGVTMRMAKEFAERHSLTLRTFHGFEPVPECFVDAASSNCSKRTCALTFFQWDNHAYFTKSSRGFAQKLAHDDDEEEEPPPRDRSRSPHREESEPATASNTLFREGAPQAAPSAASPVIVIE